MVNTLISAPIHIHYLSILDFTPGHIPRVSATASILSMESMLHIGLWSKTLGSDGHLARGLDQRAIHRVARLSSGIPNANTKGK